MVVCFANGGHFLIVKKPRAFITTLLVSLTLIPIISSPSTSFRVLSI